MKAIRIDVDGSFHPVESLSLKVLQTSVGGYVEAISSATGETTFWCNEEGKLERLPVNRAATELLYALNPAYRGYDILVGPVVVTGGTDDEGDTTPINAEALDVMGLG
jgi:hypothetical protein